MSSVSAQGISKEYAGALALRPLDLEVGEGEFLTLLGPSGCGKTTTLRLLAGFLTPTQGRILFGGEDVTRLPPQDRRIGMVFQDYALFPHMSVADNIGFGLVEQRRPKAEIADRVAELLQLVRLPGAGGRYPAELSGGQQQRVAVARAVAHSPRLLLMDEPLGALDLKLREAMQQEIRRIQKALNITTVYVTHDQLEAMAMSDRIAIMNHGRMEQIGTASEIYEQPRTRFVADFVGQINLLSAKVGPEGVFVAGQKVRVDRTPEFDFTLGVRPEQMRLLPAGQLAPSDRSVLRGKLVARHFVGNITKISVDLGAETTVTLDCHPNDVIVEVGEAVQVAWLPDKAVTLVD